MKKFDSPCLSLDLKRWSEVVGNWENVICQESFMLIFAHVVVREAFFPFGGDGMDKELSNCPVHQMNWAAPTHSGMCLGILSVKWIQQAQYCRISAEHDLTGSLSPLLSPQAWGLSVSRSARAIGPDMNNAMHVASTHCVPSTWDVAALLVVCTQF